MRPSAVIEFLFGFCRFSDISERFKKTKSGPLEAEKLAVTGERNFFRLTLEEKFLESIHKNPYFIISSFLKSSTDMED